MPVKRSRRTELRCFRLWTLAWRSTENHCVSSVFSTALGYSFEASMSIRGVCGESVGSLSDPSWNTDQGVLTRARVSGSYETRWTQWKWKTFRRFRWDPEVGDDDGRTTGPFQLLRQRGGARVYALGPERLVNYAWAGRSQRKLWWRPEAVLTCKSIAWLGYRGERLIEPSSSWFPPKFPSG